MITKAKNLAIRALAISYRLARPKRKCRSGDSRKFLVVSTTGIGDTLWGTPALAALKETYPDSRIGVLTNPAGYELLKGNPCIDDLFIFRRGAQGVLSAPVLTRKLSREGFDTAFIFHASDRIVWLITFLSGVPEIIGMEGQNKGLDFILTRLIPPQKTVHGIEARLNLVSRAGAVTRNKTTSVYLSEEDRESASRFCERYGLTGHSPLIGLHPGAQKTYKCWPPERFIELGRLLTGQFGCRIVVTGNAEEKSLADRIASAIDGAMSVAGSLRLRESAALIERLDIFVTNDTGPMHVAFALGTPTVALFSPTDPRLCGPYQAQRAIIIEKPGTCKPCAGKKCYNPVCMEQTTPQEVVTAVESLLGKPEQECG